MDTLGITGYGTLSKSLASDNSDNSTSPAKSSGSSLDMDDFLKLLAAQFQNQDVTNPMDNTEFISELAQFSSLQAMNELTSYMDAQYGASLVGKNVVVATIDDSGNLVKDTGVVSTVDFSSSQGTSIIVNEKAYALSSVMQVLNKAPDASSGSGENTKAPSDGSEGTSGTDGKT